MASNRITGRVKITAGTDILLNKAGAKITGIGASGLAAVERKEVLGDVGWHGYVEEPVVASLEVTISDRDDVSLSVLSSLAGDDTNVVTVEPYGTTIKSYTLNNATSVGNFELTAGEGETTIKYIGSSWSETPTS